MHSINFHSFRLILSLVFTVVFFSANSQKRLYSTDDIPALFENSTEIIFTFKLDDKELLESITRVVSIDDIQGQTVIAYANQQEMAQFLNFNIPFEIVAKTAVADNFRMITEIDVSETESWDFYPTYEAYLSMMNQFESDYPGLCRVFSIGNSVQNRQLMMAKISANVDQKEPEPQFLYTGTMHGDETTGYILLLRLIDHLLSNYGTNSEITGLLDHSEIWINPLANPDGTYRSGNSSVNGATRYNANNIDLNRNYPDPEDGPHPDGNAWQPETIAFMQLAGDNHFVMSANTHGGSEVINYPWDTWSRLAADNDWWIYVCREYVDTVHVYSPASYMDGFNNGITNGYTWYTISGGRQDYMNYFHNCREVTMELSNTKLLPASQLNDHWEWNYRSLINYIKQVTYGISGTITDLETGLPVKAKVLIDGHDLDNSHVFSDTLTGYYQRLLEAGNYSLTISAPGYYPETISNIVVTRYANTSVNMQLDAGELEPEISSSAFAIEAGSTVDFTDVSFGRPQSWMWFFEGGIPSTSSEQNPSGIYYSSEGGFDVKLIITNSLGDTALRVFQEFIQVQPAYVMSNQTITLCNGLFYDSGGASANYGNNQNLVMTFISGIENAKIKAEFLEFSLQPHSSCYYDWLKIYDGESISSPLIGTWCGIDSPGTIIPENESGALTFQFKSNYSVSQTGWKVLLSCVMDQEIQCRAGWSGVSSYLIPVLDDIEMVTQPLGTDLLFLQGQNGTFQPLSDSNTITQWITREGYIIKLSEEHSLIINGSPLQNPAIQLGQGWNILPVPTLNPVSSSSLNVMLGNKLIIIKEIASANVFWPEFQIETLQWLIPGNAYLLKTSEPVQIIFTQP